MSKELEIERQKQADREYLRAWNKLTPAQRRAMREAGITGPDAPQFTPPKSTSKEESGHDPLDHAPSDPHYPDSEPEEAFADEFLDGRRAGLSDVEAARRAYRICADRWETNAYSTASRIVLLVLQLLTRSKWWGLARAAETLVLAVAEKLSDDESQAALGRKYGVTRAAINKDVQLIKREKSFGHLTAFFFRAAGKHVKDSARATAAHRKDKALRSKPPENSLMGDILKRLAA
jgi:hypothetical protein